MAEKKETKKKVVKKAPKKKASKKKDGTVKRVMQEYKEDELHSGSTKGPKVKSHEQAVAIALSEARKAGSAVAKRRIAGEKVKPKHQKKRK
jgi:hypothetical protein